MKNMTHLQKFAACRLALVVFYVATFFVMLPIFGLGKVFEYHWPVGLLFIGLLFIRPAKGDPAPDERDESISRQAWNRSSVFAGRFTLLIVVASWIYVSYRGDDTIDHGILRILVAAHIIAQFIGRDVIALKLSRGEVSNAEG